jgi:hypothetical protein
MDSVNWATSAPGPLVKRPLRDVGWRVLAFGMGKSFLLWRGKFNLKEAILSSKFQHPSSREIPNSKFQSDFLSLNILAK